MTSKFLQLARETLEENYDAYVAMGRVERLDEDEE